MQTGLNIHFSWSDLDDVTPISTSSRPLYSSPSSNNYSLNRAKWTGKYSRREAGTGLFIFADELLIYIFSFLDPVQLSMGTMVCKEFRRLIQDEVRPQSYI